MKDCSQVFGRREGSPGSSIEEQAQIAQNPSYALVDSFGHAGGFHDRCSADCDSAAGESVCMCCIYGSVLEYSLRARSVPFAALAALGEVYSVLRLFQPGAAVRPDGDDTGGGGRKCP